MFRKVNLLYYCCILILFANCKKDVYNPNYETFSLPINTKIETLYFLSDSVGFAAGGKRLHNGYIFKTSDAGANWSLVYETDSKINKLKFFDKNIAWACGDSMLIVNSADGGNTWNIPHNYDDMDKFRRTNINDIHITEPSRAYMCGERTYFAGRFYFFNANTYTQYSINDISLENGLFALSQSLNNDYVLIYGYGMILKYNIETKEKEFLDIMGDIFVSATVLSCNTVAVCGYDGGIYLSANDGASWNETVKSNKLVGNRKNFLEITSDYNDNIYVSGEKGLLYFSTDKGLKWKTIKLNTKKALPSIFCTNNYTYVGSEDGKIYRISN